MSQEEGRREGGEIGEEGRGREGGKAYHETKGEGESEGKSRGDYERREEEGG